MTSTGALLFQIALDAETAMEAARITRPDAVAVTIRISAHEGFGGAILAPALAASRPSLRIELAARACAARASGRREPSFPGILSLNLDFASRRVQDRSAKPAGVTCVGCLDDHRACQCPGPVRRMQSTASPPCEWSRGHALSVQTGFVAWKGDAGGGKQHLAQPTVGRIFLVPRVPEGADLNRRKGNPWRGQIQRRRKWFMSRRGRVNNMSLPAMKVSVAA